MGNDAVARQAGVDFKIEGLDCAEEVAALRKALGGVPGVERLDFDILRARMTVIYDPDLVGPAEMAERVARTGMRAVPWAERDEGAGGGWLRRHGRQVSAGVSGTLLAGGLLAHWALHGSVLEALTGGHGAASHRTPLPAVLLYLGAMVSGAWYIAPRALSALRRLQPDMNLLMVVAAAGAVAIGEYFEAATVVFLFAVALLLEHWSIGRARRAIEALLDLAPPSARYRLPGSGEVLEGNVAEVPTGAVVLVRPGERVPLDGVVRSGRTSVNQAPITGESTPVEKGPGEEVFAGTINEDGFIEFEVTRAAPDTTLARIIHLVEETQSRRAPAQQWVDRFSFYYTPAMMGLAVVTAALPPLLSAGGWAEWFYRGLVLLVIACPCAMVISTPVGIVSALTSAARRGVLVKGGLYLEAAGRVKAVALDKTGTLTRGRPEVQEVVSLAGHSPEEVLERAASLEARSQHPLARAILRHAEARGIRPRPVEDFQEFRGRGGAGLIDRRRYWIGSHRMMHEEGRETPDYHRRAEELEARGHTVVAVGNERHVCGMISLADGLRPEVHEAIDGLRRAGVRRVVMLTGDNQGTARAIAREAGLEHFFAELMPEEKLEAVKQMVEEFGEVAMVGDGVNDAPAMAAASLGVAMGDIGTDVAVEAADVTLMSDDLRRLPWLLRHSRRTLGMIKQNIALALGLKGLFLVLNLLGAATLWMAILADTGASLAVIFRSLTLLRSAAPGKGGGRR